MFLLLDYKYCVISICVGIALGLSTLDSDEIDYDDDPYFEETIDSITYFVPDLQSRGWHEGRSVCRRRNVKKPEAIDLARSFDKKLKEKIIKKFKSKTFWLGGTLCPERNLARSSVEMKAMWTNRQEITEKDNINKPQIDDITKEACFYLAANVNGSRVSLSFEKNEDDLHLTLCQIDESSKSTISILTITTLSISNITSTERSSSLGSSTLSTKEKSTSSDSTTSKPTTPEKSTSSEPTVPERSTSSISTTSKPTVPERSTSSISTTSKTTTPEKSSTTIEPTMPERSTSSISTTSKPTTSTESIVSTSTTKPMCKGREAKGILWNDTEPGQTIFSDCPIDKEGKVLWTCDENTLDFTPKEPIFQCESKPTWIGDLLDKIANNSDPMVVTNDMENATRSKKLTSKDISTLTLLLGNLKNSFDRAQKKLSGRNKTEFLKSFTNGIVSTLDNLLLPQQKDAWKTMVEEDRMKIGSSVFENVEDMGWIINCQSDDPNSTTMVKDNIAMQTYVFMKETNKDPEFPSANDIGKSEGFIRIPNIDSISKEKIGCPNGVSSGIGMLYKNIGDYLKYQVEETKEEVIVNSAVISFSLDSSRQSYSLPDNLKVSTILKHTQTEKTGKSVCAFWNFTLGKSGSWSTNGCETVMNNKTHTECACNHLTNFAVLVHLKVKDETPIRVLTIVCCTLSSISLIITLVLLISIRSLHCRRSTITCNLCACLLGVNVFVLVGLDRTEIKEVCALMAALLQYVVLGSFFWMLLEGFQIYQMIILVFSESSRIRMYWFYIFGYGLPAIIVAVTAGIRPEGYGMEDYCWLSKDKGVIWSFAAPSIIIIAANFVILVLALRSASSVKVKQKQSSVEKLMKRMKGSFSIMCLLGITWIIAVFRISETQTVLAYLFTILNGLQGFFIFLFQIVLNDNTRPVFIKLWRNFRTRSKVSRITSFKIVSGDQQRPSQSSSSNLPQNISTTATYLNSVRNSDSGLEFLNLSSRKPHNGVYS